MEQGQHFSAFGSSNHRPGAQPLYRDGEPDGFDELGTFLDPDVYGTGDELDDDPPPADYGSEHRPRVAEPANHPLGQYNDWAESDFPPQRSPGTRLWTYQELLNVPHVPWLVDGFLPAQSLAILYGEPGSGKTFLSLDLAMCIANGFPYFGHGTQQAGVVYVSTEDGQSEVAQRLEAWHEVHGESNQQPLFIFDDFLLTTHHRCENVAEALETYFGETRPGLIILDTLSNVSVGLDDNSAKDMNLLLSHFDYLRRRTGASVLTLHHTNKNQKRGMRGSGALNGRCDTIIVAVASKDGVTLEIEKQRSGPKCAPIRAVSKTVGGSLAYVQNNHDEPEAHASRSKNNAAEERERLALIALENLGGEARYGDWQRKAYELGIRSSSSFDSARKALLEHHLVLGPESTGDGQKYRLPASSAHTTSQMDPPGFRPEAA